MSCAFLIIKATETFQEPKGAFGEARQLEKCSEPQGAGKTEARIQ